MKTNSNNLCKVKLCIFGTLSHAIEIKEPIHILIFNYPEIEYALKINKDNEKIKFLYFNKNQIHKILYESEEMIEVNHSSNNITLDEYFYLNLLINDNTDIVNYIYSLDYIDILNNFQGNNSIGSLKKILLAKIIIDLINNYEGKNYTEDTEEKNIERTKDIKLYNINIIENNNIFKEYNIDLKDILSIGIEDIYVNIIYSLIKMNKFDDFDFIKNILDQLDFEQINITKKMFEKLSKILNMNDDLINLYSITKFEDFYNIKKINFNYFLYKYILKDSFYIYNIPFLFKTRKIIIDIINHKLDQFLPLKVNDNDIKIRVEYLLKVISDLEYYFIKYLKYSKIRPLEIVLNYYKEYCFESKKNEIKIIEEILNNNCNNDNNYEQYLKDLEIAKKMNKRIIIIKNLYNFKKGENSENQLNIYVSQFMNIEKMINEKKVKKIKKEIKINLIKFFNNENNKELLLEIFSKDIYDFFINTNIDFLNENEDNKDNKDNKDIKDNNINKEIENNSINEIKSENSIFQTKVPKSTNITGKLFLIKLIFKNYR